MRLLITRSRIAVALFLALGSVSSCSSRPTLTIHEADALSVVLREIPAGYPLLEPYTHPYEIPPHISFSILESLRYDDSSMLPFSRTQPRHVFTRSQAESLAPHLSHALSQASLHEITAFTIADEDKPNRRTKGLVFVLDNELHVIIEDLHKPVYQGDPQPYQQQLPKWELLLGDRQRHYAGRPGGKGVMTNWIITPLR